jgi:hypothetical protein
VRLPEAPLSATMPQPAFLPAATPSINHHPPSIITLHQSSPSINHHPPSIITLNQSSPSINQSSPSINHHPQSINHGDSNNHNNSTAIQPV